MLFLLSLTRLSTPKTLKKQKISCEPKGSNKLYDNFVRYLKGLTLVVKLLNKTGLNGAVDQSLVLVPQVELIKLLITVFSSEHLIFLRKK